MSTASMGDYNKWYDPPSEAETINVLVGGDVEIVLDVWVRPTCKSQPFFLIHGLASNARMWDGVAGALMRLGHPVAVLDLRGHGRSSKPDGAYDFPTICDDIEKVQDYLTTLDASWGRVIAVGQSWGASLVLELAWRSPKRLFGIGCVDGGFSDLSDIYPDWQVCMNVLHPPLFQSVTSGELEARIRATHMEWPESGIKGLLANFSVDENDMVSPWLSLEHHLDILHSLWTFKASARHAAVAVPVILIPAISEKDMLYTKVAQGKQDIVSKDSKNTKLGSPRKNSIDKREAVREAARKLAKADVYEFLDAEHDVHASRPDELANLLHKKCVDSFFSGLDA